MIDGRQIDAYAELDDKHSVAIEVTEKKDINKVQEDLNKLIHVRNCNFNSRYKQTECLCVTEYDPTPAMRAVGQKINIDVISAQEFQARLLPFDSYDAIRKTVPFGSAIDPETGQKDTANYVSVSFITQKGGEADATIISDKVTFERYLC